LSSLLDLPAVDLKINFEEQPLRRSPRQSRRSPFVDRGKSWSSLDGLRPVAATALTIIGLTTGISLAGYWLLLRPIWTGPVVLPTVASPAGAVARLGSTSLQPSPPPQMLSQQPPQVETQAAGMPAPAPAGQWVIQTGVFTSARRAAIVVGQLTANGYPAFHRQQTFVSHGTLQVAFAGPYASQTEAETARMTLRRVPGFEDAHVRELRTP
jgi:hypothetical protein